MRTLEVGTVCVKTTGREAGQKAVVMETIDDNYVLIQGSRIRKRKCNVSHLMPIGKTIKVNKSVTQKELAKELEG